MNTTDFNVIIESNGEFKPYNIIPRLLTEYDEKKERQDFKEPKTFEDYKKFVIDYARYMWWARCQYEIILVNWPGQNKSKKWDVFMQVMMNIDLITEVFINALKKRITVTE